MDADMPCRLFNTSVIEWSSYYSKVDKSNVTQKVDMDRTLFGKIMEEQFEQTD